MNIDDRLHRVAIRKLDIVKETAAQESVGQFLFIVRCDHHNRPLDRAHGFLGFINMEFHAIEFLQQVVWKLDIGLVDLVDQQHWRLVAGKGFPQFATADVVGDVVDACVAKLTIAQPCNRVIFIQALLRLGGRLDVPFDQFGTNGFGDFVREHGFAGAGLALDQQWTAQRDGGIHRDFQIIGRDIICGAVKTLHSYPRFRSSGLA